MPDKNIYQTFYKGYDIEINRKTGFSQCLDGTIERKAYYVSHANNAKDLKRNLTDVDVDNVVFCIKKDIDKDFNYIND